MIAYVKKANNSKNAVPQRDALNEALNQALKEDGTFDFYYMLRNYTPEFDILLELVRYMIEKKNYYLSPSKVYVLPVKKYEHLFEQFEAPIFQAIKKALADDADIVWWFGIQEFFLKRAVLSDLPERLKEKVAPVAKIAHGENFDTTAILEDKAKLITALGEGKRGRYFFRLDTFEFLE